MVVFFYLTNWYISAILKVSEAVYARFVSLPAGEQSARIRLLAFLAPGEFEIVKKAYFIV
jgi:hypothetical protein